MFQFRERTKIGACRIAFMLVCVVPTFGILAWAAAARTPAYRQAHQQAIAAALGCRVELGAVRLLRPGVVLYEQLSLEDPETHELLAELPSVEVHTGGAEIAIYFAYPATINGRRLDACWTLAHARLRQGTLQRPIVCEARNLTLTLAEGDVTFTDVAGELRDGEQKSQLRVSFQPASANPAALDPAQLLVTRQRSGNPVTTIQLDTGSPLPCSLVRPLVTGISSLGDRCTFAGQVAVLHADDGWQASLSGDLVDIDLDALFRLRFAHKFSGSGSVRFERAEIVDGRLQSANGVFAAGPGMVSESLLRAAQLYLGMTPRQVLPEPGKAMSYERLGMEFAMDASGLTVHGKASDSPGAVLVGAQNGVILVEGTAEKVEVVNLIRTLVPNRELQVPAARETAALHSFLPIPSTQVRPRETPLQARLKDMIRQ